MEERRFAARAFAALEKNGFRFTRSIGQNFLLDADLVGDLVSLSGVSKGDNVLEIGPGAGLMTAILAHRGAHVTAVELDAALEPVLRFVLEGLPVRLVFEDALKSDFRALMGEEPFRIAANLPYYITSDAIAKCIKSDLPIQSMAILVQKEAAERIVSVPGEKSYCALSALVRSFGEARILREIPPEHFTPRPHVMSALLSIEPHAEKPYSVIDQKTLYRVIASAFAMRRKTFANNLISSFALSRAEAERVLERSGLHAKVRGEELDVAQFASVADALTKG